MRERFLLYIGTIGGAISSALGGWDAALHALVFLMIADFASGLVLAGVFKKSYKSECGGLCSSISRKGVAKKCMMLLMVAIGVQVDSVIGWDFVRYCVIIAFMANELISITENMGMMGIRIPPALKQAIDILKKKEGDDNGA
jgi:toxin secretion/phage lysis holin